MPRKRKATAAAAPAEQLFKVRIEFDGGSREQGAAQLSSAMRIFAEAAASGGATYAEVLDLARDGLRIAQFDAEGI